MEKLRWGILSTAKIGTEKVIPAMQQGERTTVVAVRLARCRTCARPPLRNWESARALGSYEELLLPIQKSMRFTIRLPNHMHVDWSIQATRSREACTVRKADRSQLSRGANGWYMLRQSIPDLKVMEAFMYRHHPQWQRAKSIIDSNGIGELRTIQSFFSYFNVDAQNIRNQKDIGGGALMDIGCYNISLSRFLFGGEPIRALGWIEHDAEFDTDRISSGILEFSAGTSTFTCSTQLCPYQRISAFGTTGRVEIEIPFNAPPDRPCKMWHQTEGGIEEITFDICDQYTIQGDLFARAVQDNVEVPTPLEDAVQNMRVIEAIVESADGNRWVDVSQEC